LLPTELKTRVVLDYLFMPMQIPHSATPKIT